MLAQCSSRERHKRQHHLNSHYSLRRHAVFKLQHWAGRHHFPWVRCNLWPISDHNFTSPKSHLSLVMLRILQSWLHAHTRLQYDMPPSRSSVNPVRRSEVRIREEMWGNFALGILQVRERSHCPRNQLRRAGPMITSANV